MIPPGKKIKLTEKITETEFENGYWYIHELKEFAKKIGIQNSSKLRKDQLEKLIKSFIRTGRVKPSESTPLKIPKDYELGLTPALPVKNFTDNQQTKEFIKREALRIRPGLKNDQMIILIFLL